MVLPNMMVTSRFLLARLLVAPTLLLGCRARDNNNDTAGTTFCPDPLAAFNASDQTWFHLHPHWTETGMYRSFLRINVVPSQIFRCTSS
jgi:hypothetical protein